MLVLLSLLACQGQTDQADLETPAPSLENGSGDASIDPCDDGLARFSRSFSEKSAQKIFWK